MGSFLEEDAFQGLGFRVYYIGDLRREPNLENYPCVLLLLEVQGI